MTHLLDRAEKIDGYQTACEASPLNHKARQTLSYTAWMDQSLAEVCRQYLPPEERVRISIVIMNPSADGGMPHTRGGDIIAIPAYYPEQQLPTTMRHEYIHVLQRRNSAEWKQRLEADGWQELKGDDIDPRYVERCRINPDTFQSRWWAWRGRWVPLPLFVREDKPTLREVEMRWWDREEGVVLRDPPRALQEKYAVTEKAAWEHPYELYAYLLQK